MHLESILIASRVIVLGNEVAQKVVIWLFKKKKLRNLVNRLSKSGLAALQKEVSAGAYNVGDAEILC